MQKCLKIFQTLWTHGFLSCCCSGVNDKLESTVQKLILNNKSQSPSHFHILKDAKHFLIKWHTIPVGSMRESICNQKSTVLVFPVVGVTRGFDFHWEHLKNVTNWGAFRLILMCVHALNVYVFFLFTFIFVHYARQKLRRSYLSKLLFTNLLKSLGPHLKPAVVSCPWDSCKPSHNTVLPLFGWNGITGIIHTGWDKGTEKAKDAIVLSSHSMKYSFKHEQCRRHFGWTECKQWLSFWRPADMVELQRLAAFP